MRWDRLFADLEAQFDAATEAEFSAEVADRSRREVALVRLVDRLRGTATEVQVGLDGIGPISGVVAAAGPDWVLLTDRQAETLVLVAAITWVRGAATTAEPPTSAIAARLGLGHVLRGLARDRAETALLLRSGERITGTVDRVGADFIDLAEHPPGEPPRGGSARTIRAIPTHALAALRRQ